MESQNYPAVDSGPIDWELLFCSHVLRLESLHWGLWSPDQEMSLEGLRHAQEAYTNCVLELIPSSVNTALDVGCGMGDVALKLAGRGIQVTSISPIANYDDRLKSLRTRGVVYRRTRFEDFESDHLYDLVMMVESCGYFEARPSIHRAMRLLRPGGFFLVANPFRIADVPYMVGRHVLSDYREEARQAGFVVQEMHDITSGVLPTLELLSQFKNDYVLPTIEWVRSAAAASRSVRLGLMASKLVFRRKWAEVASRVARYSEQLHPQLFERYASYVIVLFRLGQPPTGISHAEHRI